MKLADFIHEELSDTRDGVVWWTLKDPTTLANNIKSRFVVIDRDRLDKLEDEVVRVVCANTCAKGKFGVNHGALTKGIMSALESVDPEASPALAERREVTARFLGFEGYAYLHHDHPFRFAVDEVIRLQDKAEAQP